MPTEDSSKNSNSRWWEYYAMRYALGVGIGTPIVGLLLNAYGGMSSPKVSMALPTGTISALYWAAAGTAYCYVASVPMLTLHSTRRVLSGKKIWVVLCIAVILIGLALASWLDLSRSTNPCLIGAAGLVALCVMVIVQFVLLGMVLLSPNKTHRFYDSLSKQRIKKPDFVESYRHMREHGNAVSIVIFELLLGFILWSLKPMGPTAANTVLVGRVSLILTIWLAPSSLVWLIGSSLERFLSRAIF